MSESNGTYNVVVGMKGIASDATETWRNYEFYLDRVPPTLGISSPPLVNGSVTVSKPYLQLLGWAGKPVYSLSYDISNAAGIYTNLDVLVQDQYFDTNILDFTTNYFHAYDVALATNNNAITVRVTDRAGNTTATNFNVVLDYSGATNAPVVNLIWPQDGWRVSGSNVTLRGTLSDETGSIIATVVNGDGTTNVVAGLVERNGMFWVEKVPLNGTNWISVQATDAAGHVAATNFTVKPSSLKLTIDSTPTGDALYEPVGLVTGTVSDPTASVTVNGTNAIVATTANAGGTYNWTAAEAPLSGNRSGTVTIDAKAAANGNLVQLNQSPVQEMHWEVVYHQTLINYLNDSGLDKMVMNDANNTTLHHVREHYVEHYRKEYAIINPANNFMALSLGDIKAGQRHEETAFRRTSDEKNYTNSTSMTYNWAGGLGWYHVEESGEPIADHALNPNVVQRDNPEWLQVPDVSFVRHYSARHAVYKGHYDKPYAGGMDWLGWSWSIPSAATEVKLWTGGRKVAGQQSLFCGTVDLADEYREVPGIHEWGGISRTAIARTKLRMLGKQVGADGKVWTLLPDGATASLTVQAPGYKHFDADSSAEKYKPVIAARGNGNNYDDLSVTNPEFCVGQLLTFSLEGNPPATNIDGIWWHLPGKYVNQATNYSSTCTTYVKNDDLLTNATTQCWYVRAPGGACSVRETLHFSNGQSVNIAAAGGFTIYRPSVNPITINGPFGAAITTDIPPLLSLEKGPMAFDVTINSRYAGSFGLTQLVKMDSQTILFPPDVIIFSTTWGNFYLDWREYYDGPKGISGTCRINDTPGQPLILMIGDYTGNFKTYVRFTPAQDGSIPITLGSIDWSWAATCSDDQVFGWTVDSDGVDGPVLYPDDSFPLWPNVRPAGN